MKRSYDDYSNKRNSSSGYKPQKKRRALKRNDDVEDEIEKGGSSQDKFESDFIDDEAGS
jgi:hypothetical protein